MLDLTSDLDVLAATIYGESRGESTTGKQAVAAVVLNRAAYAAAHHYPEFGDGSVRSACLAPWQFSCWNKGNPNLAEIQKLDFSKPTSMDQIDCLTLATTAVNGSLADPTNGCLFYKTTVLPWPKDWGKEVPADVVIGHQSFYKLGLVVPSKTVPIIPAVIAIPQEPEAGPSLTFWQRIRGWLVA
jgi:N-acetylmuramoyl-L-alanine amidase